MSFVNRSGFKFSELEIKLVLSSIIEKFVFAPGPKVVWEMSLISRPTYPESGNNVTQLPVMVSLYEA